MAIIELALDRLLIDEELNPRDRLNAKHVDEFVEMGGEWPPLLVRPISAWDRPPLEDDEIDSWYTHQLVDGFHRAAAAERLGLETIQVRSEEMDDATATARAIRENLHGLPLAVEQRMAACVRLGEAGWTPAKIAEQTGISQAQVYNYLAANRVTHEIPVTGNLSIDQAARLDKLVDSDVAEERAQASVIAEAASKHKLPASIVSALADAAKNAPEHTPRIVERAVEEKLAPDAIRTAGKVLGDTEAPQELKAHLLESHTLIQDAEGNIPPSEISRAQKMGEKQSLAATAYLFSAALVKMSECVMVDAASVQAWLDSTPVSLRATPELTLDNMAKWLVKVQELFAADKRGGFRTVK